MNRAIGSRNQKAGSIAKNKLIRFEDKIRDEIGIKNHEDGYTGKPSYPGSYRVNKLMILAESQLIGRKSSNP